MTDDAGAVDDAAVDEAEGAPKKSGKKLILFGAIGLVWFSVKEGKEAFEKAEGKECSCHDDCAA